ncbi:MAG: hypothetical protein OK455_10735 [Thaumarchaeota archaeon]|nr:hypothetical protein [Nitrososphaerota archaeon]
MSPVAMVGWSGAGRLEDLQKTAAHKLSLLPKDIDRIGGILVVAADDPVVVARRLSLLPGVSWIAVGYRFRGVDAYLKNLETLSKRYLSSGETFRIMAEVFASTKTAGDMILAGNSALLSFTPGTKVNEKKTQVTFRVCLEGHKVVCGAEIRTGPGGVPTGDDWVSCIVSGGERSSALAWMAALSGFSLRLVHSRTDEASLRRVAKLYSELSSRMDASHLELVVLEGEGDPFGRIGTWLRESKGAALAGLRMGHPDTAVRFAEAFPNLLLPLLLVQVEAVLSLHASLGLGPARKTSKGPEKSELTLEGLKKQTAYFERTFGGVQADSNEVIDAMKRQA